MCNVFVIWLALFRYILGEQFTRSFAAHRQATMPSASGDTRRPLAVDVGAGCGLTTMALVAAGFDVIATDKAAVVPLLEGNIRRFMQELLKNSYSSGSVGSAKVVEFDWFRQQQTQQREEGKDAVVDSAEKISGVEVLPVDEQNPDGRQIDLIVCSDCVYSTAAVEPLTHTLDQV
jgi:predicted nicotinamide N-methyase